MHMKKTASLGALAALVATLAGCGGSSGGGNAGGILIVGSSTVYPFTTAIAEAFQRANAGTRVTVESTGTGSGMKLFCDGVGGSFPDIVNASRPMKRSEYDACVSHGAKQIIEVPIGIDGLTIIEGRSSKLENLTQRQIYAALAANPFGRGPNQAQSWRDIDPALPDVKIRVLGPPPTSGTRDSLADLYLEKGCNTDPAMAALKKSDEKRHKDLCTKIREDGAFVEAGENDNLLVQKVAADPGTLGVLGFSYLEQNLDRVRPVKISGVSATEATISDLSYPGARRLFVYLKGEHLAAKPRIRDFFTAFAGAWGPGGLLEKRGLVPFKGADAVTAATQARTLAPLDPASLK
jgi:phosphate transport system substrate-binding protein